MTINERRNQINTLDWLLQLIYIEQNAIVNEMESLQNAKKFDSKLSDHFARRIEIKQMAYSRLKQRYNRLIESLTKFE